MSAKGNRRNYTCSFEGCDRAGYARTYCEGHYAQSRRRRDGVLTPLGQQTAKFRGTDDERFDARVAPRDENGCALWVGSRNRRGYGWFTPRGSVKKPAHRWAYERAHGSVGDLVVMHSCDNPSCVALDHLSAGTHGENMSDMRAKGRSLAGEDNPHSRLTERQALEILNKSESPGFSQTAHAKAIGVSVQAVNHVIHGRTWNYLSENLKEAA